MPLHAIQPAGCGQCDQPQWRPECDPSNEAGPSEPLAWHRDLSHERIDAGVCRQPFNFRLGRQSDAMAEHRQCHFAHFIRRDIRLSMKHSERFCRAQQHDACARACAETQVCKRAGIAGDFDDVVDDGFVHIHAMGGGANGHAAPQG